MRDRFNKGCYYDRMKSGEFKEVIVRCKPAKTEILADYGPDTLSVLSWYRDKNDDDIVQVHYYRNQNGGPLYRDEQGVLRTDGKPDPKMLFEDRVLYHLSQKPKAKD
jgi:hypothetical protein